MTKKERELLLEVHQMTKDTHDTVSYWKNEMRVNGSVGLESTLKSQHDKIHELWDATAKIRSKFKFRKALNDLLKNSPILQKIADACYRIATWAFWFLLLTLFSLSGIDWAVNGLKAVAKILGVTI